MKSKQKATQTTPILGPPSRDLLGRELSDAVVFFHESIASYLGMSVAEWKCLGLLQQYGPATAGRLAQLSGFTTGAITGIVDRLQKAGYVRREPHSKDRRSVIIRPLYVPGMMERITPIFQSLGTAMAEMASHYNEAELIAINAYLRETTKVLRSETAKLRRERRKGQDH